MKIMNITAGVLMVLATTLNAGDADESLATRWASLVTNEACFTGGENYGAGSDKGMGFGSVAWQSFLNVQPQVLIPFLTGRFTLTNETRMHVCCWHYAGEGELAVYACQHALRTNWFACSTEYAHLHAYATSRTNWLSPLVPIILTNDAARADLTRWFTEGTKRSSSNQASQAIGAAAPQLER